MPDLSVFEPDVQSGSFSVNGSPFDGYDLAVSPPAYGSEGKTPGGFAGTSPMEPANAFAVRGPTDLGGGVTLNPAGMTNPSTPTVTAAPTSPFDYSKLPSGEPQLMPPTAQFSTPYYAARTNDGDLAGAVMVAEGQKIRMVDKTTGDVVFEGAGPEGAKQATAIANAMSQDKGRKAAWAIEADNGQGGYTVQAAERYDPKKQSLIGKVADFALPVIGAMIGGPLGAAAASAVSSVAQGRSLKDTALRAAISAGSTLVGGKVFGPAASGGVNPATNTITNAAGNVLGSGGVNTATNTITNAAGNVLGSAANNTVSPVFINAARSGLSNATANALGAGAGGPLSTIAGNAGNNVQQGDPAADTLSTRPTEPTAPTDVSEVVITAQNLAKEGLSVEQMIALGIPGSLAIAALQGVSGAKLTAPNPVVTNADLLAPPGNVPLTSTPASLTGPPQGLLEAIKAGNVPGWIAANPLQAAQLGLTAASIGAGLFGGNGSNGNFTGGVGPNGSAGTAGSLDPIFRAQLPASRFAVPRQQNNMSGVDFARYGQGPQQNFFKPPGMRRGGEFAVKGGGDGRADHVPAMLSDGEYVIDAETVALLGNGSSKAGADALDKFRIGVRKHKGKSLAAGKFSVKAKSPEAYVKGAR